MMPGSYGGYLFLLQAVLLCPALSDRPSIAAVEILQAKLPDETAQSAGSPSTNPENDVPRTTGMGRMASASAPLHASLDLRPNGELRRQRRGKRTNLKKDSGGFDKLWGEPKATDNRYSLVMLNDHVDLRDNGKKVAKEIDEVLDVGLASVIIGFIALDMGMLYMLNSRDPQVRSYSSKCLGRTVAIFIAVLIEHAMVNIWLFPWGIEIDGNKPLTVWLVTLPLCFLAITMSILVIVCIHDDDKLLHMATMCLPHAAAFVATASFAQLQVAAGDWIVGTRRNPKRRLILRGRKYWHTFFAQMLCAILSYLLFRIANHVAWCVLRAQANSSETGEHRVSETTRVPNAGPRANAVENKEVEEQESPEWMEELWESMDEAGALVAALLSKRALVFLMTHVRDYSGRWTKACASSNLLLWHMALISFLIVGVIISSSITIQAEKDGTRHWNLESVGFYMRLLLSWACTEMNWWVMQKLSPTHETTQIAILNAAGGTVMTMILIVAIDRIADTFTQVEEYLEPLIDCAGITLGLCWELAFTSAIHHFAHRLTPHTVHVHDAGDMKAGYIGVLVDVSVCVSFILLLGPGWGRFIAPVAMQPTPQRTAVDARPTTAVQ